jgi:hypothetical protein
LSVIASFQNGYLNRRATNDFAERQSSASAKLSTTGKHPVRRNPRNDDYPRSVAGAFRSALRHVIKLTPQQDRFIRLQEHFQQASSRRIAGTVRARLFTFQRALFQGFDFRFLTVPKGPRCMT